MECTDLCISYVYVRYTVSVSKLISATVLIRNVCLVIWRFVSIRLVWQMESSGVKDINANRRSSRAGKFRHRRCGIEMYVNSKIESECNIKMLGIEDSLVIFKHDYLEMHRIN